MNAEADSIRIEEQGAPSLHDEGEEPERAAAQLGALVLDAWTPEEASRFVASIYTTGILIAFAGRKGRLPSIEEWPLLAAQPAEFPGSGQALQPVLDRFLPKSAGGSVAALAVGALSIAGEVGMATGRRAHLLRKEDRGSRPAPGAAATSPSAAGAAHVDDQTDAGVFHFDESAAEILRQQQRNDSYADMGMGSAA